MGTGPQRAFSLGRPEGGVTRVPLLPLHWTSSVAHSGHSGGLSKCSSKHRAGIPFHATLPGLEAGWEGEGGLCPRTCLLAFLHGMAVGGKPRPHVQQWRDSGFLWVTLPCGLQGSPSGSAITGDEGPSDLWVPLQHAAGMQGPPSWKERPLVTCHGPCGSATPNPASQLAHH